MPVSLLENIFREMVFDEEPLKSLEEPRTCRKCDGHLTPQVKGGSIIYQCFACDDLWEDD
jgi:hypothetical protein